MRSSYNLADQFSASPIFSETRTAHSGPELVHDVPNPYLAQSLASSLIADRTEIIQSFYSHGMSESNFYSSGVTLKRF